MRDFNSSTESFSDCTWPLTVSSLPLTASFCAFDLLLQGVHGRAHLLGLVRGLLRQVLQHAKARVQRGLQPLHHVQQLLHLRLQLDHLLRGRVRPHRRRSKNHGKQRRRKKTIANCTSLSAYSSIITRTRGSPARVTRLPHGLALSRIRLAQLSDSGARDETGV